METDHPSTVPVEVRRPRLRCTPGECSPVVQRTLSANRILASGDPCNPRTFSTRADIADGQLVPLAFRDHTKCTVSVKRTVQIQQRTAIGGPRHHPPVPLIAFLTDFASNI